MFIRVRRRIGIETLGGPRRGDADCFRGLGEVVML
jgi:hypothetical protein